MNREEFAYLVKACRAAQAEYYRTRQQVPLQVAKDYERRVDEAVKDILFGGSADLFEQKGPEPIPIMVRIHPDSP